MPDRGDSRNGQWLQASTRLPCNGSPVPAIFLAQVQEEKGEGEDTAGVDRIWYVPCIFVFSPSCSLSPPPAFHSLSMFVHPFLPSPLTYLLQQTDNSLAICTGSLYIRAWAVHYFTAGTFCQWGSPIVLGWYSLCLLACFDGQAAYQVTHTPYYLNHTWLFPSCYFVVSHRDALPLKLCLMQIFIE